MGRTKKIPSLPSERRRRPRAPQTPEIDPTITTEDTPTVTEVHRVNRTWVERKTIDEIEAGEIGDYSIETESDEPDDPIQAIIDEIQLKRANWAMHVYRLPNYGNDQRTDPKSRRFCGTLSIPDGDYLLQDTYLQDIQEKFARPKETNIFLLILRRNNTFHGELPVVTLEPPPADVLAKIEAPGVNGVTILNQSSGEDPIKTLVAQVKQLSQIRDALLPPELLKQISPQQMQNNPPLTTETATLHLLNQDGQLVDEILGKFKHAFRSRDGHHEPTFMDIALAAINNNTLPKMMDKAMEMLSSILSARNGHANGMAAPPAPAAPVPPGAAPPQVETQPAVNPIETANGHAPAPAHPPEIVLLNFAIHQCAYNANAAPVAEWIISFEEQNPSVAPYLNMFIAMPPADALEWLSKSVPEAEQIAALSHAQQWISDVQNEIKKRTLETEDQN